MPRNLLVSTLLDAGRETPDAVAVSSSRVSLSFRDVDELSAQFAHALNARGVRPGDRVAVQTAKRPEVLALNIACARAGALYVPLNTSYTPREFLDLLDDAAPVIFVRDGERASRWAQVSLDELGNESREHPVRYDDVETDESTPAAIVFTSGTTGRPKGAVLTHGNLSFGCTTLNTVWEMGRGDVTVHVLPLFHVHGLFVAAYCSLSSGGTLRFLDGFDVSEVLAALAGATVLMGVPTHYTRLLTDPRFTAAAASSLRVAISGSAPMRRSTHEEFFVRTGQRILERYGMTETGMITSNPLHGERKPGTVGLPLPGVEIRLDSSSGVVQVRGPNVFAEYWRRHELRESDFSADGYFITGDLATIDDDGYVEIVGRVKDVVITGGLNVYPKEVEQVLDEVDGVRESTVVGVPDDDFGETLIAVVVAEPGVVLDIEEVIRTTRATLAPFKVPRRVVVVDELPRNTMGKVQKALVRANLLAGEWS